MTEERSMETNQQAAAPVAVASTASLSVWQRAVAIFVSPASAWGGLAERAQWWFPLVVTIVMGAAFAAALHERAVLPMITENWQEMVDSGKMSAEQLERMEAGMSGPAGVIMSAVQQVVVWPIILALMALVVWFGVGFILGTRVRFRHAFEVVAWSALVIMPGQILTGAIAWSKQTLSGIHLGFGILLPEPDTPTKLHFGLASFLDALGPLSLWSLVVTILGATALSGAPRKSVAWVLGGAYVALAILIAVITAMFAPGT
jgi:hypothetical protein